MNSSHICQTCHRRLAQLRSQNLPQWHQRASFISLSKTSSRTTIDDKPKDDILNLGDDVGKKKGRFAALPERRRRIPQLSDTNPGDALESLFEQSITEAVASEKTPTRPIASLRPYKKVEALKEMMKSSAPLADSFHFFVENFGPNTGRGPESLKSSPSYLLSTARNLLRQIISATQRDPHSTTLPTVTEISSVYLRLGMLPAVDWTDMMSVLIHNIIDLTERTDINAARDQRLFADLVGAWNVVCRAPGNFKDIPEHPLSQLNWSHIPVFSSHDAMKIHRKHGASLTFGILVPPFPMKSLSRMPSIALSTFQLLHAKSNAVDELPGGSARFISALARIITVPGLVINDDNAIGKDEKIASFIKKHFSDIKVEASRIATSDTGESFARVFTNSQVGFNRGISFVNKRLYEALKTRNRHAVDELWSDVVHWPVAVNLSKDDNPTGTLSAQLCNYFILVFMGLREPNRAIDVWNHMIKNHLMPTLETWDSMISGCKAAKDHVALEGVWRKMHMAGVQPDAYCWTTRISGLMACRQLDAAIRALDEMGRIWLAAAQKEHPKVPLEKLQKMDRIKGAVKPVIETVNAAIVGALRLQRKEYASQVLAWAGNYGISPDVNTYNTLLNPLLRSGQTQQAMILLQQMQNAGIEADESTFTTILDETFRFAADLSPEEQKEAVFGVLDEMEQAGLKANLHTYGKIIYALLQSPSGDMSVVNIVLERMARVNLEPSTHIYTTLIQHYFNSDPPQLDAVRSTIDRASVVQGSTDHIFWDRVVEGYARVDETAAALRILGKAKSTQKISWTALRELLRALARNEEWDMAKALVRDQIIDTGGPLSSNEKGKEGQHQFWNNAQELGLLNGPSTGTSF